MAMRINGSAAGIPADPRVSLLDFLRETLELAGLTPDRVGGLNGGLASVDDPALHESYASILGRARREGYGSAASSAPSTAAASSTRRPPPASSAAA